MKIILIILILIISLGSIGCQRTERAASSDSLPVEPLFIDRAPTDTEAENLDKPAHFCGAKTLKGKFCTRRVKGAPGAKCFQHRDKKKEQKTDAKNP